MTSYHFSIKKNTKSAKAHCDYILRENTKNTIEKKELIFTKNNLPKWANNNPKKFWSECDKRERVNGIKYRELEFTLQNELSLRENAKIMKGVLEKFCKNKYYTLVVHDKKQSSIAGERNLGWITNLTSSKKDITASELPLHPVSSSLKNTTLMESYFFRHSRQMNTPFLSSAPKFSNLLCLGE